MHCSGGLPSDEKRFFSSTAKDLYEFREAVYLALEGMDGVHCVRMEDFGARSADAQTFCPEKIAECDLIVVLAGLCFDSSSPDSDRSFTELEYDHAVKEDVASLVFLSTDNHFYPGYYRETDAEWSKQDEFRSRLKKAYVADFFKAPDELAGKVIKAVGNWLRETEAREEKKPPEARMDVFTPGEIDLILVNATCRRPVSSARQHWESSRGATLNAVPLI